MCVCLCHLPWDLLLLWMLRSRQRCLQLGFISDLWSESYERSRWKMKEEEEDEEHQNNKTFSERDYK